MDAFFAKLAEVAPTYNWDLYGSIRGQHKVNFDWPNDYVCPVTAVYNSMYKALPITYVNSAGKTLGLTDNETKEIQHAADGMVGHNKDIRKRLERAITRTS
jgi:hypothetical protein